MQGKKLLVSALVFLLSCCSLTMYAQQLHGVINGTVTDPSGAVIPNATVKVVQRQGTTLPRTVQTDSRGSYTVSDLPAASYDITITAPGFQTYQATDLTLFVAQTRTVNASLKPGAVSQTVTVQQSAVSLNTTTSELAGTISGKQVTQLQLNNRNFEQLVTLQPGVVSGLPDEVGFGLNNTSSVAINGARDTANNWTVDGADINDSGSNSTLLNVPSVDAIQEFTLERSTYDAEFGRSGAGQILVATKSGTSQFHGDAYEFNRNNVFNANFPFNKQTTPVTPRPIERYNDFGFTIGGPLYIPKVYPHRDKLFFFWSEEWRKVTAPQSNTVLAPSASDLAGTFTGTIPDATPGCVTYTAATNTSVINPSCYSQDAKVYLTNLYDKFPANAPGGFYTFTFGALQNTREDLVRFDANLTDKLHFFGRAMQDESPSNFPMGLFAGAQFPTVAGAAVNAPGENVVGNLTWTISPKMVNEAEFAYSQGTISSNFIPGSIASAPAISSQLTRDTAYQDPYGRIPNISFQNGITGFSAGVTPYFERNLDRNLFDNFTVTLGNHTLRTGASIAQMLKTENASNGQANFLFSDFSQFLLGNTLQYSQSSRDTVPDLHYFNMEAYVQDDWKISSQLTLNLGMRYSYFPSPADVKNTLNNFVPSLFNPSNAPAIDAFGNFVAGGQIPATYTNGLIFPTGAACAQAQSIAPSTKCSPWGNHVNPDPLNNWGPRFGFAYMPFASGKTAVHGGYGIFYDRMLNGIWEQNAFQDPPLVQTATIVNTSFDRPLGGVASVSLGPNHIVSTGNPTMKNPSYMDFNLSVQQQLQPNTVAEVAYVGTLGRHLLGDREINQPTLAERAANPNVWVTGVVPYRGYSWFAARLPEYVSNYHSLQVSVNHRSANGLTLGIAYTWSKQLTNQSVDRGAGTYDTYNPGLDYGPSTMNQPQTFIANYVYELPFYRTQKGFVGHTLGGWELSGITSFTSGQSFAVNQPSDNFDCTVGPTGACVAGSAPGTYPGGLNMDPSDIAPRPDRIAPIHMVKKQLEWFNPSSFAPAVGHFGNAGQGIMLGPGLELWDLSGMKNFAFGDKAQMQFRAEFFNAFNHTSYSGVDTELAPGFGAITGTHDPREIQFGGKVVF